MPLYPWKPFIEKLGRHIVAQVELLTGRSVSLSVKTFLLDI